MHAAEQGQVNPTIVPAASEMREWTDKSGQRHVQMALLRVEGEKLFFRKADGKLAATSLAQISETDRRYVANFQDRTLQQKDSAITVQRFLSIPLVQFLFPRPAYLAGMQTWLLPVSAAAIGELGLVLQPSPPLLQPQVMPATLISLRVSRNFLEEFIDRSVNETISVRDCILGTRVVGTANITGQTRLVLQSNSSQAVAEIELAGTAHSRTVGFNGPAILHNQGQTPFNAHKRIVLGDAGLDLSPAQACAQTFSQTLCIESVLPGLRGRLVKWIAWRRVEVMRPLANSIAAGKAATRIGAELNEEVSQTVAEVQQTLRSRVPELPYDYNGPPAVMRFSSTADCIEVAMVRRGATSAELALQPPAVAGNPDLAIRIHQTVLRSAVTSSQIRQALVPLLAELLRERKSQDMLSVLRSGEESLASSINLSFDAGWILADFTDPKRQRTAATPNLPLR